MRRMASCMAIRCIFRMARPSGTAFCACKICICSAMTSCTACMNSGDCSTSSPGISGSGVGWMAQFFERAGNSRSMSRATIMSTLFVVIR